MLNKTLPAFLATLFLGALLAGADAHAAKLPAGDGMGADAPSCSYSYNSLAFDRADKKKTYWKVDVKVSNHSKRPVSLEGMRYSLLHQQDTLLSDWKSSDRVVQPGQSASFESILSLPNKVLKNLPKSVLKDPEARFTLIGDAYQESREGSVLLPRAVQQTILVDMPKQMAKARKMFFRSLFSA